MNLTDMVLMPGADYQAICDAIRERTGNTALLKSGDIPAAIRDIMGDVGALGEYMYSFGAVSDIHVGVGVERTPTVLQFLHDAGAKFVVCAGDTANSGAEAELESFSAAANAVGIDVFSSNGNHDYACTDDVWQEYLGHPLRHVFEHDSDVYIILPLNAQNGYGNGNIQWLSEQLAIYKGRRIFVVTHFPIPGYAGLRPDTYYGFSSTSTEDDTILALMNSAQNVIHLSGHTHLLFEAEDTYNGINCMYMPHCRCATVHVPSTTKPRTADWTETFKQSEGYLVDVYKNAIAFRGIDFVNGTFLTERVYVVPVRHSTLPEFTNAIITSAADLSVDEGGSGAFTVRLANSISEDVVVRLSVDNSNISLASAELTFTPDNYGVDQLVRVSAIDDDVSVDFLSVITLEAANMLPKHVSVTVANTDAITLTAISADYRGGDVVAGTSLSELAVVVTASYSDGTSETVTGYTLSGQIDVGTNTITVSYGGMQTTFTVTGTAVAQVKTVVWSHDEYIGTISAKNISIGLTSQNPAIVLNSPMDASKEYYIRADSVTDSDGNNIVPAKETVYLTLGIAYSSADFAETANTTFVLDKYADFVTGMGAKLRHDTSAPAEFIYGYNTISLRASSSSKLTFPQTFTIRNLEIYTFD